MMGFPDLNRGAREIQHAGFIVSLTTSASNTTATSSSSAEVSQCLKIIQNEKLPIDEFYIECSASTVLLSLGRRGLIGSEIQSCQFSGIGLFDGECICILVGY